MGYLDRMKLAVPQDIFSREYIFLARCFVEGFGAAGEGALREAVRSFGVMRGRSLREAHRQAGMKLNLFNLFTYGDLPAEPRTRRNKIKLTPEERLSETLLCPLYDQWRAMDAVALGRIYCEEFHHANFAAYAPRAQVNLTQTLTQEGDDLCRFSVYLRPANMDDAERALSFEGEGDAEPSQPLYQPPAGIDGYTMLAVRLLHAAVMTMQDRFGEPGIAQLRRCAAAFGRDAADFMAGKAGLVGIAYDREFVRAHFPLPFPGEERWRLWQDLLAGTTGDIIQAEILPQIAV